VDGVPSGTGLEVGSLFLLVTHTRERQSSRSHCNRSNTDRMFPPRRRLLRQRIDTDSGIQCRVIASRRVSLRTCLLLIIPSLRRSRHTIRAAVSYVRGVM